MVKYSRVSELAFERCAAPLCCFVLLLLLVVKLATSAPTLSCALIFCALLLPPRPYFSISNAVRSSAVTYWYVGPTQHTPDMIQYACTVCVAYQYDVLNYLGTVSMGSTVLTTLVLLFAI